MKWRCRILISAAGYIAASLIAIILACSNAHTEQPQQKIINKHAPYLKNYTFSSDWFTHNIPEWKEELESYKGKPGINYLEVGTFEGRSLIWMLENVLTDPTARCTGIDIFTDDLEKRFRDNVALSGFANKVTIIKGDSALELRRLPFGTFDIIYIDGSHFPKDVLSDAVLAWPLLKNGGLLIFDDYLWNTASYVFNSREEPVDLRPKTAIDSFILVYGSECEVIYRRYQVFLRKKAVDEIRKDRCAPLGQYTYYWKARKLYYAGTNEEVELSDKERELIEKLLLARDFEGIRIPPQASILKDENAIILMKKLGVKVQ